MKGWWAELSLRDRGLIGSAAGLLVIIIVWYGIVSPMLGARSGAEIAREAAARQLATLERLLAVERARMPLSAGTTSAGRAPYAGEAFKTEVTRSAQSAGLAISRFQGGENGRFSLVFEQADARQLYYWMNEVENRLGGRIERMSIDQAVNGRVRATIDVMAGGI
jgi:general secretion pathway protein M